MQSTKAKGKQSLAKVVGNVYLRCGEGMEQIIDNPRIVFPILITFLTPLLFYMFSFKAYVPFLGVLQGIDDMNKVNDMAKVGVFLNAFQNMFMWLFRTLLIFIFIKCLKLEGSFKQVLSITGFAYLTIVPMMIIMCIAGQFTGNLFVNFSVAVFFPALKGTFLYGFLRGLCIFMIWQHVVIGIGCWKLTKSKALKWFVVVIFFLQVFMNIQNAMIM